MSSEALRQWVADQSGVETIWLHPNAPRPDSRPYATVRLNNSNRVHREVVGEPDGGGIATVTGDRDAILSIQIVGDSSRTQDPRAPLEMVELIRDTLELPSIRASLRAAGWVLREIEMITDIPAEVATGWEPRAAMDVRFGRVVSQTDDVGLIESTEVSGTAKTADGGELEIDFNVEA